MTGVLQIQVNNRRLGILFGSVTTMTFPILSSSFIQSFHTKQANKATKMQRVTECSRVWRKKKILSKKENYK